MPSVTTPSLIRVGISSAVTISAVLPSILTPSTLLIKISLSAFKPAASCVATVSALILHKCPSSLIDMQGLAIKLVIFNLRLIGRIFIPLISPTNPKSTGSFGRSSTFNQSLGTALKLEPLTLLRFMVSYMLSDKSPPITSRITFIVGASVIRLPWCFLISRPRFSRALSMASPPPYINITLMPCKFSSLILAIRLLRAFSFSITLPLALIMNRASRNLLS